MPARALPLGLALLLLRLQRLLEDHGVPQIHPPRLILQRKQLILTVAEALLGAGVGIAGHSGLVHLDQIQLRDFHLCWRGRVLGLLLLLLIVFIDLSAQHTLPIPLLFLLLGRVRYVLGVLDFVIDGAARLLHGCARLLFQPQSLDLGETGDPGLRVRFLLFGVIYFDVGCHFKLFLKQFLLIGRKHDIRFAADSILRVADFILDYFLLKLLFV